ncbi:MAG: hypothetical protein H0T69_02995 [Thermoleophilaceae bacterium]|nr:hypothetical protein [Thermoleophilaceae bacterium]
MRPEPDGVTLGDPAFEPLPGARADYGRLGGSVYQIEVPAHWNGRLLLFMHGFGELEPTAEVSPPGIRRYLIGHGFAWGASSFSSTSLIPGRAADETAALWDLFARRYTRPPRAYVTGQSMGGAATHIAAERYGNRFDGALALCGAASQTSAASIIADFFAAAAYTAGVTQPEFDRNTNVRTLIHHRILPALRRPRAHRRFEDIMVSLTGGPRAFDRDGFRMEEETNWHRAELLVASGIARNRQTVYHLGAPSPVASRKFNRAVIRFRTNQALRRVFLAGNETTGKLEMPLLSLHTTGDGQVPIEQARILRRRVDAAGRHELFVQRAIRDPGHCGFTSTEWEVGLEALIRWVEHGVRPPGNNVLVRHLNDLRRRFELNPRPGTPEADAVPGARRPGGAARPAHARRFQVGRPMAGCGGAEQGRTGHAVPVGALVGPPWSRFDRRDGQRGGERLRCSRCGDRPLDVRARQDHLQPRHLAMASQPRPARRRLLLERDAQRVGPAPSGVRRGGVQTRWQ